jgi:mannose-6-phosphate isomerase-like protein (cupin superfamily)
VAQVAVHVRGGGVAGLAGVDDDHGAPLAPELERCGQAGGGPADDRDVAVPLDGVHGVVGHVDTLRLIPGFACSLAEFASRGEERGSHRGRTGRHRAGGAGTAAEPADDAGPVARRARRPHQPERVHDQPDRDREATISLDVLLPLARALQVDLDALLDVRSDDDVVIRPAPRTIGGRTTWMLSRPTGSTVAIKMRLEPTRQPVQQRVHPGHDWFFVLEGRVQLLLGDREVVVEAGEAAEFGTMTPHAVTALDGPAELIMIFDRDGHRAHVHQPGR